VGIIDNNEHIPQKCLAFLNRLSDYLFTLARYENMDNEIIYTKSDILTKIIEL
jgi:cob(I)alamin adenosyltransferase